MSHTVTLQRAFRNFDAVKAAAAELGYQCEYGSKKFFENDEVHTGLCITLPGWKYPAVVKEDGSFVYDNYGGQWGKQELADQLSQVILAHTLKAFADAKLMAYSRELMEDGVIEVQLTPMEYE